MAKLTLNIDEDIIRRAKAYAREHDTSVSKLVTGYLATVTADPVEGDGAPILRRLRGALAGAVPEGTDYRDVLAEKYR